MLLFIVKGINLPTPTGEVVSGSEARVGWSLSQGLTLVYLQGCPPVTWMPLSGLTSLIPMW